MPVIILRFGFQQPTQSDMTMYELNFSLLVEQMFSKIVEPAYRQLVVEVSAVVSHVLVVFVTFSSHAKNFRGRLDQSFPI